MSKQFIISVSHDDRALDLMAENLKTDKGGTIVLALHLLNYVLEQRKAGRHLSLVAGAEDRTKDILEEAAAGSVKFSLEKR